MWAATDVIIRLSPTEIQQALAIELDGDSEQALQFIKERIVTKCFPVSCKYKSGLVKEGNSCKLRSCNAFCCIFSHPRA
jgi:hypothetical protein